MPMIVCPHCNHQNPDEAIQCEACYTPLPTTTNCPNCGTPVQTDATFCGQCGFNLKPEMANDLDDMSETIITPGKGAAKEIEEEEIMVAPTVQSMPPSSPKRSVAVSSPPEPSSPPPSPHLPVSLTQESGLDSGPLRLPDLPSQPMTPAKSSPKLVSPPPSPSPSPSYSPSYSPSPSPPPSPSPSSSASGSAPTRLQIQTASLFHVQTQTRIELPYSVSVIHIGKPNEQIPPDIDVSGFPDSEIVSRIHADIRVEGDTFYIEDTGSSNGTYINHTPLSQGNRHKLRSGDRVSLGKGDKVTFVFQLS